MGVMGRANAALPGGGAAGHSEPFLNKDEIIRYRTPLAITAIDYDRYGSGQYRTPRWIVVVEAWDVQNFPIPESAFPPDQDVDQPGILTFGDSELRQAQFNGDAVDENGEKTGLKHQLAAAQLNGVQWIGPVTLVSARSNAGNNYKTLADVRLDDQGNIVTDGRGFPVIEGAPEPQPPRQAATPAPATRASRSTGQRSRAAARTATAPQTPPAAPAGAPPAAPRVFRRATTPAMAQEAPAAPEPAPAPAAARAPRQRAQQANPTPPADQAPPSTAAYEAQQQREAQREAVGPAPNVRQIGEAVPDGQAECPFCHQIIEGRLYPAQPDAFARFYGESAKVFGWPELDAAQKAAGGQVIPHPNCPVIQQTIMLPFVEFAD